MNFLYKFWIFAIVLASPLFLTASEEDGKIGRGALTPQNYKAEKIYLTNFGHLTWRQSGLHQLGLSETEKQHVVEGFIDASKGSITPTNLSVVAERMSAFFQEKATLYQARQQESLYREGTANRELSKNYFSELDRNKRINKTESGLYYEIISAGSSPQPLPEDSVVVSYKGTFIDGREFDSSDNITFPLGDVMPGFTEGLQYIGQGGNIILYMPADLCYGDREVGFGEDRIPPGSALIFNILLTKINVNTAHFQSQ